MDNINEKDTVQLNDSQLDQVNGGAFSSYVGTWECCENKELGARITVYGNGTITLFSSKNPAFSGNYTYGINSNGFMATSNGTVFAPNGFNHLIDSNGRHWDRIG